MNFDTHWRAVLEQTGRVGQLTTLKVDKHVAAVVSCAGFWSLPLAALLSDVWSKKNTNLGKTVELKWDEQALMGLEKSDDHQSYGDSSSGDHEFVYKMKWQLNSCWDVLVWIKMVDKHVSHTDAMAKNSYWLNSKWEIGIFSHQMKYWHVFLDAAFFWTNCILRHLHHKAPTDAAC